MSDWPTHRAICADPDPVGSTFNVFAFKIRSIGQALRSELRNAQQQVSVLRALTETNPNRQTVLGKARDNVRLLVDEAAFAAARSVVVVYEEMMNREIWESRTEGTQGTQANLAALQNELRASIGANVLDDYPTLKDFVGPARTENSALAHQLSDRVGMLQDFYREWSESLPVTQSFPSMLQSVVNAMMTDAFKVFQLNY